MPVNCFQTNVFREIALVNDRLRNQIGNGGW